MTEDQGRPMPEDSFDARISRYLSWEAGQLRGAPDRDVVMARVASRTTARHRTTSPALVWVSVIIALLLVAAAIFIAGNQSDKLVVAPSSEPTPTSLPNASPASRPSRTPITGSGPCRDGRIDMRPMDGPTFRPAGGVLVPPAGGRIAMALEESDSGGSIVVSDPSRDDLQVVATFTGEDVRADSRVQVRSWSPDGHSLLVYALSWSNFDDDRNCGDLFLVKADGTDVQRLTDYGPGEVAEAAVFSPSMRSAAYTLYPDHSLHVVTLAGGSQAIPIACRLLVGALRWAPDEQRILVQCEQSIVVVDLAEGQGDTVARVGPLDARWTADAEGIVAALGDVEPGLEGGPLSIVDVDPANHGVTTRVYSSVSTEWVLGVPSLSPDGRWLLVEGDGNVTGLPYYPTYLVDTSTGATTKLPWPVMTDGVDDPRRRDPRVTWLPGNDRVLTVQEGILYEVDLRAITRTRVGAVPALDYAWFATP
jgi:hypothetical protein